MVESQRRGNVRQGDDPGPDAPKRSAPKTPPTAHTDQSASTAPNPSRVRRCGPPSKWRSPSGRGSTEEDGLAAGLTRAEPRYRSMCCVGPIKVGRRRPRRS
jgi:hypothetical protein